VTIFLLVDTDEGNISLLPPQLTSPTHSPLLVGYEQWIEVSPISTIDTTLGALFTTTAVKLRHSLGPD
jgi:hypothetical protein